MGEKNKTLEMHLKFDYNSQSTIKVLGNIKGVIY